MHPTTLYHRTEAPKTTTQPLERDRLLRAGWADTPAAFYEPERPSLDVLAQQQMHAEATAAPVEDVREPDALQCDRTRGTLRCERHAGHRGTHRYREQGG